MGAVVEYAQRGFFAKHGFILESAHGHQGTKQSFWSNGMPFRPQRLQPMRLTMMAKVLSPIVVICPTRWIQCGPFGA